MYYAPYRYYTPATARWLTRDPLGMADGPNVYAYVKGSPTVRTDPSGREAEDFVEDLQKFLKNPPDWGKRLRFLKKVGAICGNAACKVVCSGWHVWGSCMVSGIAASLRAWCEVRYQETSKRQKCRADVDKAASEVQVNLVDYLYDKCWETCDKLF